MADQSANRGNVAKGIAAVVVFVPSTILCCLAIYLFAFLRMLCPFQSQRDLLAGRMDEVVSVWVGVNEWMLRSLRLIEIRTDIKEPLGDRSDWWIVISNHQSWSDIIAIQVALLRRAPIVKFITKRELIWVPFVGLAMWLLRFPYVRRFSRQPAKGNRSRYARSREDMSRAAKQFLDRPIAVLTFLEGTRFTADKHKEQQSEFIHLLNPRTGGLAYVLEILDTKVTKIVDLTLIYEGSVPGFWDLLCGRCRRVEIDIRTIEINEQFRQDLKASVIELWRQKDASIEKSRSST